MEREQREIKFRCWSFHNKEMYFGNDVNYQFEIDNDIISYKPIYRHSDLMSFSTGPNDSMGKIAVMQFTGLKDRTGREVYEGDIIEWKVPYRTTQTHTGDNIPNGSYTEPMEPAIKTYESEVYFKDGMFVVDKEDNHFDSAMPLDWAIQEWDEDAIRSAISWRASDADFWDDPEEGDLQYLLQEYKLNDLQALITYLSGIEITGNVFSNPELLQP